MLKFVSALHFEHIDCILINCPFKITITLLLGVAAAAPSGLVLSPAATAPLAYYRAPLTYAEPATLTRYESISSPLTYTASHQPAVALSNLAPTPLAYTAYSAGYPVLLRPIK